MPASRAAAALQLPRGDDRARRPAVACWRTRSRGLEPADQLAADEAYSCCDLEPRRAFIAAIVTATMRVLARAAVAGGPASPLKPSCPPRSFSGHSEFRAVVVLRCRSAEFRRRPMHLGIRRIWRGAVYSWARARTLCPAVSGARLAGGGAHALRTPARIASIEQSTGAARTGGVAAPPFLPPRAVRRPTMRACCCRSRTARR